MSQSRRNFLQTLVASGALLHINTSARPAAVAPPFATIDREAFVSRHDPVSRQVDPLSPLSVGNGEFAFTADVTGLQTMEEWKWDQTWGWDYPMTAMTAARLGETRMAVDALLLESEKNRYLPNGHNWQRTNLPCYLPGNGGLLYAVAMMAAGWRGSPASHAPGFPSDGSWTIRWEKLNAELIREI